VRDGKSVDDLYVADRAAHPSIRFYTLSPEEFALDELFAAGGPPRTHFTATVFRGHLEKGGGAIDLLTDIDVRVKHIVHHHTFEGMDKLPTLSHAQSAAATRSSSSGANATSSSTQEPRFATGAGICTR
jgi:hypothetical protein